jgi:hypothetical protein
MSPDSLHTEMKINQRVPALSWCSRPCAPWCVVLIWKEAQKPRNAVLETKLQLKERASTQECDSARKVSPLNTRHSYHSARHLNLAAATSVLLHHLLHPPRVRCFAARRWHCTAPLLPTAVPIRQGFSLLLLFHTLTFLGCCHIMQPKVLSRFSDQSAARHANSRISSPDSYRTHARTSPGEQLIAYKMIGSPSRRWSGRSLKLAIHLHLMSTSAFV